MGASRSTVSTAPATPAIVLAGAGLVLAIGLTYANSVTAPFVFDDVPAIVDNPSIRQLWPLSVPLSPPDQLQGLPVGSRPLVNLSLALNFALGGTRTTGYHLVNIALHALASLALFGVVRRTLLRFGASSLKHGANVSAGGKGRQAGATVLAFVIALLWSLHPLQTESVTYVSQRAESLMALCYLTTLYAFVRSLSSAYERRWQVTSVVACLLGMACKEVMVTAPLMVLLYDRTFAAGSFGAAWQRRWRYYLALVASWGLLAWLVGSNLHRGGTAGFETGLTPWTYALTQIAAIVHYGRLAVWPDPLVFDYGISLVTDFASLALPATTLVVALGATVYALVRHPVLGFLGVWFFIILSPTSSVVPITTQTMAEHRMYLPLAALCVLGGIGLRRLAERQALLVGCALALLLGVLTVRRNRDYHTSLGLWTDTAQKVPLNDRAHSNLGILLFEAGQPRAALESFQRALQLRPNFPEARANLGSVYLRSGQPEEAIPHFVEALRLKPDLASARNNLGLALKQLGRPAEALAQFRETARLNPDYAEAHHNLAISLLESGELPDSIRAFETALRLMPNSPAVHSNFAVALMRADRLAEARAQAQIALRLNPSLKSAQENLAAVESRLRNATVAR